MLGDPSNNYFIGCKEITSCTAPRFGAPSSPICTSSTTGNQVCGGVAPSNIRSLTSTGSGTALVRVMPCKCESIHWLFYQTAAANTVDPAASSAFVTARATGGTCP